MDYLSNEDKPNLRDGVKIITLRIPHALGVELKKMAYELDQPQSDIIYKAVNSVVKQWRNSNG